jgi:hypothetical protein
MSTDTDYFDDTYDNSDGGTTNDSLPLTVPPDPTGGTGAIDPSFLGTAANGVDASLGSGFASQIGSLVGLAAVNAAGNLVYKATAGSAVQVPQPQVPVNTGFAISPTTLIIGGIALVALIYFASK